MAKQLNSKGADKAFKILWKEPKTLALSTEMSTIMKQMFVIFKILGYFGY